MIQHLLHRCERCKQPRLDNGAPCSLCQSVTVESYAPAKIRPFRTYKNGMRAFYEPNGPKPARVRPDTSERARQDVLAVLRAIEGGERSLKELGALVGFLRANSAVQTATEAGWARQRWEQRENEPLGRNYFYGITELGQRELSRLAGNDVLREGQTR